jgi:hypothetical protein
MQAFARLGSLALLIALAAGGPTASAAPVAARSARSVPANGTIAVAIVELPGGAIVQSTVEAAVVDLGTVSYNAPAAVQGVRILQRGHSYIVATVIGLRATSSDRGGAVTLQAFLDSPMDGVSIRVDGVDISSNHQTFAANVPMNVVTRHRLEVEIPNAMSPGMVPADIPLEFGATAQ